MKLIVTTLFVLGIGYLANAQFVDKFGVTAGTAIATQNWDYSMYEGTEMKYKMGISLFVVAEKDLTSYLGIKGGFGYLQKGFKSDANFTDALGDLLVKNDDNVILHDLALDLTLKIDLFQARITPYLLLGFREDVMLGYRDIEVTETITGSSYGLYESYLDEFNKFNTGALLSLGCEYNNLVYIEFEYNPTFTQSYESKLVDIKDNCFEIRLGLNLNQFIKF